MKILLVKLSSLGDVVHALPVVHDIRAAIADAQIDWVVEKSFAPLLGHSLGLHRVIPCEIRRWRKSFWTTATRAEWRAFKRDLQLDAYDAVIDLQGLTKSAVVARLARLAPGGRRFAMANQTDGSGYEAPTRWVADTAIAIAPHTPAVQRSRELSAIALGYELKTPPNSGLQTRTGQTGLANQTIALVHGTSRADKCWPLDHWLALGQRLNAAGYQVGLPHGNDAELAISQAIANGLNSNVLDIGKHDNGHDFGQARAVVWPRLALDAMTAHLAGCAGVIGVDSGLSHIAVALDLPHVQIYNFDTAWRTGPLAWLGDPRLARQRSVFAMPFPSVDAVWQAWNECNAATSFKAAA